MVRYAKTNTHYIVPVKIIVLESKITIKDLSQFKIMIKPINIFKGIKDNILTCYFIINESLKILETSSLVKEFILQVKGKNSIENNSDLLSIFPEFIQKQMKGFKYNNKFIKKPISKSKTLNMSLEKQVNQNHQGELLTIKDTFFHQMLQDQKPLIDFKLSNSEFKDVFHKVNLDIHKVIENNPSPRESKRIY